MSNKSYFKISTETLAAARKKNNEEARCECADNCNETCNCASGNNTNVVDDTSAYDCTTCAGSGSDCACNTVKILPATLFLHAVVDAFEEAIEGVQAGGPLTYEEEYCSDCIFNPLNEKGKNPWCEECRRINCASSVSTTDEPDTEPETCNDTCKCESSECESNSIKCSYNKGSIADFEWETRAVGREIETVGDMSVTKIVYKFGTRKPLCERCSLKLMANTINQLVERELYDEYNDIFYNIEMHFGAFPSTGYIPETVSFIFSLNQWRNNEMIVSQDGYFDFVPNENYVNIHDDCPIYNSAKNNIMIDDRIACCVCGSCYSPTDRVEKPTNECSRSTNTDTDTNVDTDTDATAEDLRNETLTILEKIRDAKIANAQVTDKNVYTQYVLKELSKLINTGECDVVNNGTGTGIEVDLYAAMKNALRNMYNDNSWQYKPMNITKAYIKQLMQEIKEYCNVDHVYTKGFNINDEFGYVYPHEYPNVSESKKIIFLTL